MFEISDIELIEGFKNLYSRESIAELLEISDKSLRYFIYGAGKYYSQFDIKKRKSGYRTISAPNRELKYVQKKLAYILNLVYKPKITTTGFVKGRSILDNASKHKNKKIILNIDLEDFFDQFHFGRVRGLFISQPYNQTDEVATILAQLTCYNGKLPQGAPTSPVISNMLCRRLDYELLMLSINYKITYSRYADDLVFSSFKSTFPSDVLQSSDEKIMIGESLLSIIEGNGLKINYNKIHLRRYNERQEVTGVIVNKFPNVKKEYVKDLRSALFHCRKNGIYESAISCIHKRKCNNSKIIAILEDEKIDDDKKKKIINDWFRSYLRGKINFIKQIKGKDDLVYLKYAKEYNNIFKEKYFETRKIESVEEISCGSVFILALLSDDDVNQGSGFFVNGLGLLTCYHVVKNNKIYDLYNYDNTPTPLITKCKLDNAIISDLDLDYALFNLDDNINYGFEIGESLYLKTLDTIKLLGYPSDTYSEDKPTIIMAQITNFKINYLGSPLYTIDKKLTHGMSGGVVLNLKDEIIGIIRAGNIRGTYQNKDADNELPSGFTPIHVILDHIKATNF